jgi:Uma2 family endonuclease
MDNPSMVLTQSKSEQLMLNVGDAILQVTHGQFEHLCQINPDLRLELTSTGELIVMAPAGWESSERNGDLTAQVIIWNRRSKLGRVFDSSGGFTLPSGAVRSPDVTWISNAKVANLSPKVSFPRVVPDFAIELRSKTDRLKTLQEKMLEYQENGMQLGWLINPQDQEVEIYRIGKDVEVLKSPSELSGEDVLPNFILDLTTIW